MIPRTRWEGLGPREQGIVSYFGDDVKFQNMFGAWQRMSYWCSYDPEAKTAEIIFFQR